MHGDKRNIIVVVPFYKSELTDFEKKSFQNNIQVLGSYQIVVIKPSCLKLDLESLRSQFHSVNHVSILDFQDYYFSSTSGYNRLLLSREFYRRFCSSKYILICQLDTYIFSDRLQYWVSKGYDYIGAPWTYDESETFQKLLFKGGLRLLKPMKWVNRILFRKRD